MTEIMIKDIVRPEFPVWKAVAHIAGVVGDQDDSGGYPEARRQFRQAALQGNLEVWGRKPTGQQANRFDWKRSEAWSPIDPLYWRNWGLNERSIRELREADAHTEADERVITGLVCERYWDLRICENKLLSLWMP